MPSTVSAYDDICYGDTDRSFSMAMTRSARRGPWLPEEDEVLLQLVRSQGANNWVRISQQIQHRSPKQCRERYHQNLKPSLKHDPISSQEGEVIERLVQEMGKRWAEIARRLGNRSDNAVKNWWNGSVNRRRRNPTQTTTGFKQVGLRLQPMSLPSSHDGHPSQYSQSVFALNRTKTTSPYDSHPTSTEQQKYVSSPVTAQRDTTVDGQTVSAEDRIDTSRSPPVPRSRPTLPQINPPQFRPELPPLQSSLLSLQKGELPQFTTSRVPVSPASSDTSPWHAPSLVSDTQSLNSVSPRTISTPKPGNLAPIEIATSNWPENQLTLHRNVHGTEHKLLYSMDFNPGNERSKDSRMNVSALLH